MFPKFSTVVRTLVPPKPETQKVPSGEGQNSHIGRAAVQTGAGKSGHDSVAYKQGRDRVGHFK